MSLGIAIGTVFSKILCSSSSSCPEVFDKRLNCKTVLNNFKEKLQCRSLFFDKAAGDFSIGLFLYISKLLMWIAWYFVAVVGWYFLMLLLLLVLPYQIPDKVFVNYTGQGKSCFHVVGCRFSECLFKFYLNLIDW